MKSESLVLFLLLLMFASGYEVQAQSDINILGTVSDKNHQPIIGATVYIEELSRGGISDVNGEFKIENVPYDTYTILIKSVGYIALTQPIVFNSHMTCSFQMDDDVQQLENIVIHADEELHLIKSSGYNVDVIGVEALQGLSLDVNQVLQGAAGVTIREMGGLGSSFQLSLNGLSENQVRIFLDGIPMENSGSAMSLNNFPSNMIRSIEVYKGVVPIKLASDALGGSINIVTPSLTESFLDASYSFGSFNTHRASVFAQHAGENGFFVRVTSFFNHSDNNYWMNNVPLSDELGNLLGTIKTRRFHDEYTSGLINVKSGLTGTKYADELSIGFSLAKNSDNIQHPEVSINRVYGGLNTISHNSLGNINYKKQWGKLKVSAYAQAELVKNNTYDTLSRRYNWEEEYKDLSAENSVSPGEFFGQKSILQVKDKMFRYNIHLNYSLSDQQNIVLNYAKSHIKRSGEDEINLNNTLYSNPNSMSKDIIGLSYDVSGMNDRLKTSVFSKYYWYTAEINEEEYIDEEYQNVQTLSSLSKLGYGISMSYALRPEWLLKISYEKAYRLPLPDEIMGDGVNVIANPALTAESSNNINWGMVYSKRWGTTMLKSEANLFLRPATDFIRAEGGSLRKQYKNSDHVRVLGTEFSNSLNLDNKYIFGLNCTYQSITEQTKFDEGLPNTNFGQKIPNMPYFFWNMSAGYHWNLDTKRKLSFSWSARYIHEFFLYWDNLGDKDSKNKIPTQLTNDIDISYSFQNGKYNVSTSARNIFNAEAYDNFNIQKPGRAFYIKLRYFLSKN